MLHWCCKVWQLCKYRGKLRWTLDTSQISSYIFSDQLTPKVLFKGLLFNWHSSQDNLVSKCVAREGEWGLFAVGGRRRNRWLATCQPPTNATTSLHPPTAPDPHPPDHLTTWPKISSFTCHLPTYKCGPKLWFKIQAQCEISHALLIWSIECDFTQPFADLLHKKF